MYRSLADIFQKLTSPNKVSDIQSLANRLASELGWTPSYYMDANGEEFASCHIVVEHGLENSAVISFLIDDYSTLRYEQEKSLLNVSYNNLVDWHISIDRNKVHYIYNRNNTSKKKVFETNIDSNRLDESLASELFQQVIGKKPTPNVASIDDALIETISYWKKRLSAELNNEVSNEELSALFNIIIFIRALEDNFNRNNHNREEQPLLLKCASSLKSDSTNRLNSIIALSLKELNHEVIPSFLFDYKLIGKFNNIDFNTLTSVLEDFYTLRHNNYYTYDFSVMSKHALSKIYERYVAVLTVKDDSQLDIFARTPTEHINKSYGAFYTPQYLAKFFARWLTNNVQWDKTKTVAEPAVGSGIFLRSLLEIILEKEGVDLNYSKELFENMYGVDIDNNACQASRLSLSLLYLILNGKLPLSLNIFNSESITYFNGNEQYKDKFDAVISNPPFINYELQSDATQAMLKEYTQHLSKGRTDQYVGFIKLAVDILKPGGYGMFILPQSFLLNNSTRGIRDFLSKNTEILFLADLSAIQVFGDVKTYICLLIFRKKHDSAKSYYATTILKCRNFIGQALSDVLNNNYNINSSYSIYKVDQDLFSADKWNILPPEEYALKKKIEQHKSISDFLEVKQGFITGADNVFILPANQISQDEMAIYMPYLPDRQMMKYSVPSQPNFYVFYPIINNKFITEEELKENFPKTWKYLLRHKSSLQSRKSAHKVDWWKPTRSRQPHDMRSPKIIVPHISITPKFSIDIEGKYAVSHTPYLKPPSNEEFDNDLLYYFAAVMNSTPFYWYLSTHTHTFGKSFNLLEVHALENIPVPDPNQIPRRNLLQIISLTKHRTTADNTEALQIERQLDQLIFQLYNLNTSDINALIGY